MSLIDIQTVYTENVALLGGNFSLRCSERRTSLECIMKGKASLFMERKINFNINNSITALFKKRSVFQRNVINNVGVKQKRTLKIL